MSEQGVWGRLKGAAVAVGNHLWYTVLRVLWLCAYATAAFVGTAILFLQNDQGQDLLRISIDRGISFWNLFFLVGAILLGLALWYSSRLILAWDQSRRAQDSRGSELGRIWLPRLFGGLVPLFVGVGFLRLDTADRRSAWVLGLIFLAVAVALFAFLVRRRTWMRSWFRGDPNAGLTARTSESDRRGMARIQIAALIVGALLTLIFVLWPLGPARTLGTPAIVLIGFAGIALFGGLVLTYLPLSRDHPPATPLALLVPVVFGLVNDNHWIRVDDRSLARLAPPKRLDASARFDSWTLANPAAKSIGGRRPLVLVAASGGGIRAAYWTASGLAEMEKIPGFKDSLFAVSGVSGGSVGAAVYAAIRRMQIDGQAEPDTLDSVRRSLGQDFLSPVVAGLLFPDLIQRFLPYPFASADRQRFLELGFERSLGGGADNPMSRPFLALYGDGNADRIPNLLLNATVVDSGRRAVFSSVALDGFGDTLDPLAEGFSTRAVRLSAAAGASARFTYVSPAGALEGWGTEGRQKIRLVDGGYFENSGAATLLDLLGAIGDRPIDPILILIRNDPDAPPVCQARHGSGSFGEGPAGPPAANFLSEVASPFRALLNARTARGRLAEVEAARRFEQQGGAVVELPIAAVVQAQMDLAKDEAARKRIAERMVEPPLGWSLSRAVRRAMDDTLDRRAGGIDTELANLTAVLDARPQDYKPCGAH